MKRIRIRGLVAAANRTRQTLAGPVSEERLKHIRRYVEEVIREADSILADHRATFRDLPTPSQGAYRYLQSLDFRAIRGASADQRARSSRDPVRFRGLRRHFVALLDELSRTEGRDLDSIREAVRVSHENIECALTSGDVQPDQLTAETRSVRGWLAYFSQTENLSQYAEAVARATAVFREAFRGSRAFGPLVRVHFKPLGAIFRVRPLRAEALVSLQTPAICLEDSVFASMARLATRKTTDRRPVLEAMETDVYQSIRAELECLGGIVEHTHGAHHDLETSFRRVNDGYFSGALPRPRLTWSSSFAKHKLGHYDWIHDTVMISSSLDRADVPDFLLDYIVYHELLHKKIGVRWHNGRRRAHTDVFRREERKFKRFAEAEALLSRDATHG